MAGERLEASKRSSGSSGSVAVETIRGINTTRLAMVIGVSVILCILSIGVLIAIARDPKQERDYVSVLLPVLAGAISGFVGYLAGQKSRKE